MFRLSADLVKYDLATIVQNTVPRKLLVLEMNVFLHIVHIPGIRARSLRDINSENMETLFLKNKIIYIRPGLRKFVEWCLQTFDVGIWSCATYQHVHDILEKVFPNEKAQFVFVRTEVEALSTGIFYREGSHKGKQCFVKLLKNIWDDYVLNGARSGAVYNDSNTILVDDLPHRSFFNSEDSTLFCDCFKGHKNGVPSDTFIAKKLQPLLEKLSGARDVRVFLWRNTPKWSNINLANDRKEYEEIYSQLTLFGETASIHSAVAMQKYDVLQLTTAELSLRQIEIIRWMASVEDLTEVETRLCGKGLGASYGQFSNNFKEFVKVVKEIYKTTSKFEGVGEVAIEK